MIGQSVDTKILSMYFDFDAAIKGYSHNFFPKTGKIFFPGSVTLPALPNIKAQIILFCFFDLLLIFFLKKII